MNRRPTWFYEVKGTGGDPFWVGDAIIGALVILPPVLLCLWVGWKKIVVPVFQAVFC